ncbi:VOC family protein [Streptomyces typhae]|uniref:VOC family protein n=1 Tax=Streptomyces typhae TaxID=2681492 RepID=UPI0018DF6A3F|nr:hypothetical protein [Streptomyces typhae]
MTAFYERLQGTERDMYFTCPQREPTLAVLGSFLLVEGTEEVLAVLAPFRATDGTLLVDSADAYPARLEAEGAEVVEPLHRVPTGAGSTARHPDGTVIEYAEHRPTPEKDQGLQMPP